MQLKKNVLRLANSASQVIGGALNCLNSVPIAKRFSLLVGEKLKLSETTITSEGTTYRFYTPNEMTLFRARTLFTKEPETLRWISTFSPDDVFYDIGANVGTYSVFVAINGRAKEIYAFEPESQNYAALNRNIALNGLDSRIFSLNVALANSTGLGQLFLSKFQTGGAIHSFGTSIDVNRKPKESPFKQGSLSVSLDDFVRLFNPAFPNHIKIDVDGLEKEIIEGAKNTLSDPRVKSLLIELNESLSEDQEVIQYIQSIGFKLIFKGHAEMFEEGDFKHIHNYIFTRDHAAPLPS